MAEAEFCFRFGAAFETSAAYSQEEVLEAVASLHPAVEVPDSRYHEFTRVGAAQLIADTACACWFVIGPPTQADWRARDLVPHVVSAWKNGTVAATGSGANVLGDPRVALTWLVNELRTFGEGVQAGQVVPTGTCVVPVSIAPGDRVRIDLGEFGSVEAGLQRGRVLFSTPKKHTRPLFTRARDRTRSGPGSSAARRPTVAASSSPGRDDTTRG